MADKFKVAGLGELLWDHYDDQKFIGGAAANFSVHAAMCGQQSYLLSRVGDDPAGRQLTAELQRFGVDQSFIQTDIFKPTASLRIRLDADGNPFYSCSESAAFDDLRLDSAWETLAPQLDGVFFTHLAQRADTARETIQRFLRLAAQAVKLFDVNLRSWDAKSERPLFAGLELADIIKVNQQECALLKQAFGSTEPDPLFLRGLIDQFKLKMAALTLGEHGCLLITEAEQELDPGYYIAPVDVSGAGDAFAAGLMVKYLEGALLAETADFANRLAAFVALHRGAVPRWTITDLETLAVTHL